MTTFEMAERDNQGDRARQRRPGTDGVIAVLLFVLALWALAEVPGRRTAASEPRRASSWRVVLRAGDEARRRGDVTFARRAYLMALFRARGERSVIGVLSAAEGFKRLGDQEVVERALEMAAALGPDDGAASARLRRQALRDRLTATDALPMAVHVTH